MIGGSGDDSGGAVSYHGTFCGCVKMPASPKQIEPRRLYLDNAATSFPKPPAVMQAMVNYASELGASAGRGAYREAMETGRLLTECRRRLQRLFHGESPDNFIFTLNCTDALNLAVKGLIDPAKKSHAICTRIDHNSILRPLNALADAGLIEQTRVAIDPITGLVDPQSIVRAIRPDTRLIAVTHASNVTGTVQPIHEIGAIARQRGIPFVVDAAQSAGHLPIDVQVDSIDLLAAPGHKGLLGPLGTGFLYIRPGMEKTLRTLREGGTGSVSEQDHQPDFLPDKYEPGSHNAIGIVGLSQGVQWVLSQGVENIARHESELVGTFLDGIADVQGLHYFGPRGVSHRVGVFSVTIDGLSPQELAAVLETHYGILTRPGIHCAPLAHEAIGTISTGGTTRLSFGPFLSVQDVQFAADALADIAGSIADGRTTLAAGAAQQTME
jgi:cysteine desulfurase/selenocysteine lyase